MHDRNYRNGQERAAIGVASWLELTKHRMRLFPGSHFDLAAIAGAIKERPNVVRSESVNIVIIVLKAQKTQE